ncbi:MAG: ABC transporter permease [Tissierellia bacterium]|nr:ABC transporter permease [Tissierellia bacterium]
MITEVFKYMSLNSNYILSQFIRHFLISIYGVLFAAIIAIPLGFFISKRKMLNSTIVGFANVLQTIPSLAMLSVLMIGLGIGTNTVVFAVFLYSLLPILKNTLAAIKSIPNSVKDAAKGVGMSKFQRIIKVKLPLSISVIMGGIRNALVVAIGVTAIGTFLGAGGLGDIISKGINASNGGPIIISGVIPVVIMAVVSDISLSFIEKKLSYRYKK